MSAERLEAARARLAVALRTGQDTAPHRAAIAQIEAQMAQQEARARADADAAARAAADRLNTRAAELVAQSLEAARLAAQRMTEVA